MKDMNVLLEIENEDVFERFDNVCKEFGGNGWKALNLEVREKELKFPIHFVIGRIPMNDYLDAIQKFIKNIENGETNEEDLKFIEQLYLCGVKTAMKVAD